MAGITPDWSDASPQANRTTQPMIVPRFLEDTGLGWVGTTSGVSATVITDTEMLDNDIGDDQELRGGWIRMCSGTPANLGVIRAIQGQGVSAGTLTVAPALPAVTANGDRYEVWLTPTRPRVLLNLLDRLTSQFGLYLPSATFLSEVPDYDMEQDGTGAWAATNATLAKVTTGPGILGKRALSVTTTAAGGYAEPSNAFSVRPGISAWVSAQFTPSDPTLSHEAFLQLYDEENGTVLDSITTTSKRTTRLAKLMSIPGATGLVSIRMGNTQDARVSVWDEVILLDAHANDVPLPWWMTHESSLKEVRTWKPSSQGPGSDEYDPALVGDSNNWWTTYSDGFTNGGQLRLRSASTVSQPLFVVGPRAETAWASLTEVKNYDPAWAAAGFALNAYQLFVGQFTGTAEEHKSLLILRDHWEAEWKKHTRRVLSRRRQAEAGHAQWAYQI